MPADYRSHFPILSEQIHDRPLVWLDHAATSQKPHSVIGAISDYYMRANANVHRASHTLSARATQAFEQARQRVGRFLNSRYSDEIIWTHGATEALNLLAWSWGVDNLQPGDEILLSAMEHHANIVPWQLVAERTGAIIRVIPITHNGELDLEQFQQLLGEKTKVLAITHVSNALGTINPVIDMVAAAKAFGALTIIDGAQAVAHFPVDVQALGCDYYLFSGHKMYGPTGIGVLYGRRECLETLAPWQGGGEMIDKVSFCGTTFQKPPFRFEAGTPNIAGVTGLSAAIAFIESLDREQLISHETTLRLELEQGLDQIPGVRRIGTAPHKTAVVSFVCEQMHNQDLGILLNQQGIAVRVGHHCAMPLMNALQVEGTVRASMGCYNTHNDVKALLTALATILNENTDINPRVPDHTSSPEHASIPPGVLPPMFASAPHGDLLSLDRLCKNLIRCRHWQDRYRLIMQLAATLPSLPEMIKQRQNQLSGCESAVWMQYFYHQQNRTLHFVIDSEARVIRGLIVILLTALNGRSAKGLLNYDTDALFAKLGLLDHLSPSRGNGLRAIVGEMRQTAQLFL